MMAKENQKLEESQKPSRVFISANVLEAYIDMTVRGVIAFLTLGMFSYFVLIDLLGLPIYYTLPFVFLGSILLSPLLQKIKLGRKVQDKYDDFLRDVIYHLNKWQNKKVKKLK